MVYVCHHTKRITLLWLRLGLGEQPFFEVDKDVCPKLCIWGASLPFLGKYACFASKVCFAQSRFVTNVYLLETTLRMSMGVIFAMIVFF